MKNYQREIAFLKDKEQQLTVQCAMQQRMIKARGKYQTLVHVVL
jgi:hypothetical protein